MPLEPSHHAQISDLKLLGFTIYSYIYYIIYVCVYHIIYHRVSELFLKHGVDI